MSICMLISAIFACTITALPENRRHSAVLMECMETKARGIHPSGTGAKSWHHCRAHHHHRNWMHLVWSIPSHIDRFPLMIHSESAERSLRNEKAPLVPPTPTHRMGTRWTCEWPNWLWANTHTQPEKDTGNNNQKHNGAVKPVEVIYRMYRSLRHYFQVWMMNPVWCQWIWPRYIMPLLDMSHALLCYCFSLVTHVYVTTTIDHGKGPMAKHVSSVVLKVPNRLHDDWTSMSEPGNGNTAGSL